VNLAALLAEDAAPVRQGRGARYDEYDFLVGMSLGSPTRCDDLASHEVSTLLHDGLVFWPPPEPASNGAKLEHAATGSGILGSGLASPVLPTTTPQRQEPRLMEIERPLESVVPAMITQALPVVEDAEMKAIEQML